jgi:hypothetical protein
MTAIGFATAVMPLGTAIALFSTLAHALMLVMHLVLPETRGRAIASLEATAPSEPLPVRVGRRPQLAAAQLVRAARSKTDA